MLLSFGNGVLRLSYRNREDVEVMHNIPGNRDQCALLSMSRRQLRLPRGKSRIGFLHQLAENILFRIASLG